MRRPELLRRLWVVSVVVLTVRGVAQKDCEGAGTGPLGGIVRVTEQELSTLTRPALVLFHSGEDGGVGSARQLWRDLNDWSRAEGIDVVVAASVRPGEAASTHVDIQCLQQGSRSIAYSGDLNLAQLQYFASKSCQSEALASGKYPPVEKYSVDPERHDATFLKMARAVTDENYKSATWGRNSIIFVSSGMCALCKILRPAYNRIAGELALIPVQKLRLEMDKNKGNPAVERVSKAPAVLFLHDGAVTASFELRPSKDTAQYAARLVAWTLRMYQMKSSPVEVAAARARLQAAGDASSKRDTPSFSTLLPALGDVQWSLQQGEGVLVFYYTENSWQLGALQPLWQQISRDATIRAARQKITAADGPEVLVAQRCGSTFCALYLRGGRAIARFTGTFDFQSLRLFWSDMAKLGEEEAATLADEFGSVGRAPGLQHAARVVRDIKRKERTKAAHTEL